MTLPTDSKGHHYKPSSPPQNNNKGLTIATALTRLLPLLGPIFFILFLWIWGFTNSHLHHQQPPEIMASITNYELLSNSNNNNNPTIGTSIQNNDDDEFVGSEDSSNPTTTSTTTSSALPTTPIYIPNMGALSDDIDAIYPEAFDKFIKLFTYQPFLDTAALQRGIYSYGDASRLRRVLDKLLSGEEEVLITGIGTSILAGAGADRGTGLQANEKTASLFKVVQRWLSPVFVNAGFYNGATGGMGAVIHDACFDNLIPKETDLLIVEESSQTDIALSTPSQFALIKEELGGNGTFARESRMAFERLLRKALQMKNKPAVVVIHAYSYFRSEAQYHKSIENDFNVIASYYSLPSLSVRSAAYHYMRTNQPGFRADKTRRQLDKELAAKNKKRNTDTASNDDGGGVVVEQQQQEVEVVVQDPKEFFYHDDIHPYGFTGHKAMGDLIVGLLQATFVSLANNPYTLEEDERATAKIPPPMVFGNYELNKACLINEAMRDAMTTKHTTFQWTSERPDADTINDQKWGWIATNPGASITFTLDTRLSQQPKPNAKSLLGIAHLKSYEHMGTMQVNCAENCTCVPTVIDSHWVSKISVTDTQDVVVSQSERCVVKFTVGNETKSGEYKVKLIGFTVMGMSTKNVLARSAVGGKQQHG